MTQQYPMRRERCGKALYRAGLSETRSGYILRAPGLSQSHGRMYEVIMAAAGTSVAVAVVGVFLIPALNGTLSATPMQASTAFVLLALAGILLRNSSRGNLLDVEVDFDAGELRQVRRNSHGGKRVERRIPFNGIRSLFVRRNKMRQASAVLCLRVLGGEVALELVRGPEEAMSTLHRRLVRDINTAIGRDTALREDDVPATPTRVAAYATA